MRKIALATETAPSSSAPGHGARERVVERRAEADAAEDQGRLRTTLLISTLGIGFSETAWPSKDALAPMEAGRLRACSDAHSAPVRQPA